MKSRDVSSRRGRAICFIDNSNIFGGQQSAGWRIDWDRFIAKLEEKGQIWQTHFFASEDDPPRSAQQGFYHHLKEHLRWEVHLYELGRRTAHCDNCGHTETAKTEKGVDVGLATKMLILGVNRAYDTAILAAGDRDYLETVKFIKDLGLRVEVVGWRGAVAGDLASESSAPVVYLDEIRSGIEKD